MKLSVDCLTTAWALINAASAILLARSVPRFACCWTTLARSSAVWTDKLSCWNAILSAVAADVSLDELVLFAKNKCYWKILLRSFRNIKSESSWTFAERSWTFTNVPVFAERSQMFGERSWMFGERSPMFADVPGRS